MKTPRFKVISAAIEHRNEYETPVDYPHPFIPFLRQMPVSLKHRPCAICAQMRWYRLHNLAVTE